MDEARLRGLRVETHVQPGRTGMSPPTTASPSLSPRGPTAYGPAMANAAAAAAAAAAATAAAAGAGGAGAGSGKGGGGGTGGGQARFPCSKMKLDNLFLQWLALPESQSLVLHLLEEAKAGRPLSAPGGGGAGGAGGGGGAAATAAAAAAAAAAGTAPHSHPAPIATTSSSTPPASALAASSPMSPQTTAALFSSPPPLSPLKGRGSGGSPTASPFGSPGRAGGRHSSGAGGALGTTPPSSGEAGALSQAAAASGDGAEAMAVTAAAVPGSSSSPERALIAAAAPAAAAPPPPSSSFAQIPRFFFPGGAPPPPPQVLSARAQAFEALLAGGGSDGGGLTIPAFKDLMRDVFDLPSVLAYPLFTRLVPAGSGGAAVPEAALRRWVEAHGGLAASPETRMFDILRGESGGGGSGSGGGGSGNGSGSGSGGGGDAAGAGGPSSPPCSPSSSSSSSSDVVTADGLKALLAGVLLSHPGLEFLQDAPEFQDRYAETVIHRIFYAMDRCGYGTVSNASSASSSGAGGGGSSGGSSSGGRLRRSDVRRGRLLAALRALDAEDDVNRVTAYFSYEHFYVIYCKFWELDADHDFLLSKEDLLRYGNHCLTYRVVDRIFAQAPRPFASGVDGRMCYEDFVWFVLSEEDKASDVALGYWFRAVDVDGDGMLTPPEMQYFYEEQLHRMECLSQEPVAFADVLCQLHDMLSPEKEGAFTMRDLRRRRSLAGTLFNILFNLNKFVAFETRDPFLVRQEREEAAAVAAAAGGSWSSDASSSSSASSSGGGASAYSLMGGAAGGGDWDRFARAEYVRLAMEEEGGGMDGGPGGGGGGGGMGGGAGGGGERGGNDGGWDSLEAPF